MIAISFNTALALYSGILLLLALAVWLWTEFRTRHVQRSMEEQYRWRCAFCGFTYLDDSGERLTQCPQCESWNALEDQPDQEGLVPAAATPAGDTETSREKQGSSRRKRPGQRSKGGRRRR